MNGLLGIKATYGRVSRSGVIPLSFSLDHVGPLTRTTSDNALALSVISGWDKNDPASADVNVPNFGEDLDRGVSGLKIGIIRHFYTKDLIACDEMVNALEAAITKLEKLGAVVEEIATRPLQDFAACNRVILLSEACAIHKDWLKSRPEDYGRVAFK